MPRLIQLLPTHHKHDAVGAEIQVINRELTARGWQVDTYAEYIDEGLEDQTKHISDLPDELDADTIALYHFCICSPVTKAFAKLPCPHVMRYHNVTPPEFFQRWDPGLADICRKALEEAAWLKDHVDLAVGVSNFNNAGLEEMGYSALRVVPFLFDQGRYTDEPDDSILEKTGDLPFALFVGRMVPNKAPDDFMRVAAAYAKGDYPPARFILAGKRASFPAYAEYIDNLVAELGLTADTFRVLDEVSQPQLVSLFRNASMFFSMSRHEGFMVPLLESFLFGLPVVAHASAAIPETAGEAAYLLDETDPDRIAGVLTNLFKDKGLQIDLRKEGYQRLKRYALDHWIFVLDVMLKNLLNQGGTR